MSNESFIQYMNFVNYSVNEISFKNNNNFDMSLQKSKNKKVNIKSNFKSDIYYSEKNKKSALIKILVEVGNLNDNKTPFCAKINVSGAFEFGFNQDSNISNDNKIEEIKNWLALNGNAILFPYVRDVLSDITLKSNLYPPFILPTVNFVKILRENNQIKFKNVDLADN